MKTTRTTTTNAAWTIIGTKGWKRRLPMMAILVVMTIFVLFTISIHRQVSLPSFSQLETVDAFNAPFLPRAPSPDIVLQPNETIRYGLFRYKPYPHHDREDPYTCDQNNSKFDRRQLPDVPPGVLDFTVHIATSLKILFIGDSLSHQTSLWFERACGATTHTVVAQLEWREGGKAEWINVASTINGGGAVAYWRMIDLWTRSNHGKIVPNLGPGWRRTHLPMLLNPAHYNSTGPILRKSRIRFPAYDVLIHRISHPWKQTLHTDELWNCIELAQRNLNATVVIFVTAHLNNNIQTMDDWSNMQQMNHQVREFAKNYYNSSSSSKPKSPDQVDHVLVADVGRYVDSLVWYNAERLGYSLSDNETIVMDKLRMKKNPWTIAMSCAERVETRTRKCPQNNLFQDGMHFCMDRIGSRIHAVLACLLDCVYNTNDDDDEDHRAESIQQCEKACNDKFMSLRPVPKQDIV